MEVIPSTGLDKIKKVMGTEVLLCYPDFNKSDSFHLYTDASDHQFGAFIMQDRKTIEFYSRKLNAAQKRYKTTERETESCYQLLKSARNTRISC
jgi:hypothetical protein